MRAWPAQSANSSIHDVKTTAMGPDHVRFKAEIQLNGVELVRRHLTRECIRQKRNILPDEHAKMRKIGTWTEAEDFLVNYGAAIVEAVAIEVDRLEQKIVQTAPEVKHCDLEIL